MEVVVEFAFIEKLRVLSAYGFELDSDLEVGFDIDALIDFSKGSLVYFAQYLVVFAHFLWHLRHLTIKI